MNLSEVAKMTEEMAREYLEKLRWPNGPVCPHCGGKEATKLQGKSTRPGVYKCKARGCRKPFTVTVGTIFERSHVKLREWVIAAHLIASSKKGMSAHHLHRMLGVTYKTAWFIAHRLRHATNVGSFDTKLQGTVEADETYVGGKPRGKNRQHGKEGVRKGGHGKAPVVALVERDGSVRATAMPRVTASSVRKFIRANVDESSRLITDEHRMYPRLGASFAQRDVIKHSAKVYVLGDVTTNTVEGFFSLIKRGVYGNFHHVRPKHLHHYVAEFEFRYNRRKTTDGTRRDQLLQAADGKRHTYR